MFSWLSRSTERPKSELNLNFGQCLKSELFHNQTKSENAKIRTFGFQTFTVLTLKNHRRSKFEGCRKRKKEKLRQELERVGSD